MTDPKILYRCYLHGRLGDPLDLRGLNIDEVAAYALGVHTRGDSIHSARQVAAEVAALVPAAEEVVVFSAKPAAPSTSAKARRASERVTAMLAKLGVGESVLTECNRSTKHDSHSAASRRALVGKLASEGLSAAKIARELGIDPSTVRGHLRALRVSATGGK